jgi:FKBP-type peptidyl-prolyl cis-trans isomerase (trigger factor)
MKEFSYSTENNEPTKTTFVVEVASEFFESFQKKALTELGKNIQKPGFRPGSIPENILRQEIGDGPLLGEMAEMVINDVYPKILKESGINALGRPEVIVTKLALGNPFTFTVNTASIPKPILADYHKLAEEYLGKSKGEKPSKNEIEKVLEEIAHQSLHQKNKEHGEGDWQKDITYDDSFAISVSPFKTIGELREHIEKSLTEEKEKRARDKDRVRFIEKLVEESTLLLPDILTLTEIEKRIAGIRTDLETRNLSWQDFLTKEGKSETELRASWQKDIEKETKASFLLMEIAEKEKVKADPEKILSETESLLHYYGNRAKKEDVVRYVTEVLTNQAVYTFLEKNK